MKNLFNVLSIQQLEGGTYTVDTVLKVIKQITDWALAVGIALAGVALVISFIMYAVVDVDQKPRVKTRILQTLLGIFGIILAISSTKTGRSGLGPMTPISFLRIL